jgi:hypothetical protein
MFPALRSCELPAAALGILSTVLAALAGSRLRSWLAARGSGRPGSASLAAGWSPRASNERRARPLCALMVKISIAQRISLILDQL